MADVSLDFLKLLANELRWKLIHALSHSDHRVQELIALTNQPQNLVSYHLKQLKQAQLVAERRSSADARDVYYSLNMEQLSQEYSRLGLALHPMFGRPSLFPETAKSVQCVLFLCTRNSARSQMAEAILRQDGGARVSVASAGTEPADIHPLALRALHELHIDTRHLQSKHVATLSTQPFDYVITVCDRARETCPTFVGEVDLIHWSIPDPVAIEGSEDMRYAAFQSAARQIQTRVHYLIAQIEQRGSHL